MADNSEAERPPRGPGRPFPKGTSGNPGGRPRKLRELDSAIAEEHAGSKVLRVIDRLHELAVDGNVAAARIYLDRVMGPVRQLSDVVLPITGRSAADDTDVMICALLTSQLAALEQKAALEGLTEKEISRVAGVAAALRQAERALEQSRLLASVGLRP